jgi:hypothetical protein
MLVLGIVSKIIIVTKNLIRNGGVFLCPELQQKSESVKSCLATARLYYGLRIAGEKYFNKILNKKFGG